MEMNKGASELVLLLDEIKQQVERNPCGMGDNNFCIGKKYEMVRELVATLHHNINVEANVKSILSANGIAFCIVEKVDKASVDGYSFIEKWSPAHCADKAL